MNAELATRAGRTAKTRNGTAATVDRRADRVREGEAEQRQRRRHDLGRRGARAQLEQRAAEQEEEEDEEHLGGAGEAAPSIAG